MRDFYIYLIIKSTIDFFRSNLFSFIFGMFWGAFILTLDLIDKGYLLCEDLKIIF